MSASRAVGLFGLVFLLIPAGAESQVRRVVAADSTFSLELPDHLVPVQIHPEALLQYADSVGEIFVLAIVESQEDLQGWNLTRHTGITLGQMMVSLDLPEVSPRTEMEISGFPAFQYRVQGATQGTGISYLQTTIDTGESFAQMLMWSRRSRRVQMAPVFDSIVASIEFHAPSAPWDDIYSIVVGVWAWADEPTGCETDPQRFEFSDDGSTMTITRSEPFESATGEFTDRTVYVVEGEDWLTLHTYIPGETRLTEEGEPVRWDLVVAGHNELAWGRPDSLTGVLTRPLRRCEM